MPDKFHDIFMENEDFEKARQARQYQQQSDYQRKECQLLNEVAGPEPALTGKELENWLAGKETHYGYCPVLRLGTGRSIKQFTRKIGIKRR